MSARRKSANGVIPIRSFDAALFDLDGVITSTARLHAAAWKKLFDDFLRAWAEKHGEPFVPFRIEEDYRAHVDGRPRHEGIERFLASRGIKLPSGQPADTAAANTVMGLGNTKNVLFNEMLDRDGVTVCDGAAALLQNLHRMGLRLGLVSSSRNARRVLATTGLAHLFDCVMDGVRAAELSLRGKPSPDVMLAAARYLGVDPGRTIVFEDAISGVEAAQAGGFGLIVGVASSGIEQPLVAAGAHIVVGRLADLRLSGEAEATA